MKLQDKRVGGREKAGGGGGRNRQHTHVHPRHVCFPESPDLIDRTHANLERSSNFYCCEWAVRPQSEHVRLIRDEDHRIANYEEEKKKRDKKVRWCSAGGCGWTFCSAVGFHVPVPVAYIVRLRACTHHDANARRTRLERRFTSSFTVYGPHGLSTCGTGSPTCRAETPSSG